MSILVQPWKKKFKQLEELNNACLKRMFTSDENGWTAVHHAAADDKADVISFMADRKADLNQVNTNGDTPLHVAVRNDSASAIQQLIKSGADFRLRNRTRSTPLHLAVHLNKTRCFEALMATADLTDLQAVDAHGRTPLHLAALNDCDTLAEVLINICFKDNLCVEHFSSSNGLNPIHMAAKNGSVKVLRLFFEYAEKKGCKEKAITTPDLEMNTPLHLAVHGGEIKAVELCLGYGASILCLQQDHSTPVHLACSQGAIDIVKLMFKMQHNEMQEVLAIQDVQGMTPLHRAAMFEHPELVSYLLQQGAPLNAVDNSQRSAVLLAAGQKCWRSVQILVTHGADLSIKDSTHKNILHVIIINGGCITDAFSCNKTLEMTRITALLNEQDASGCSPMHYASQSGQTKALNSLIHLGASTKIKNQNNESPLHFAARYGRHNSLRHLLKSTKGFLIMNEKDGLGRTALHIASQEGHIRVVQLLLSKGAFLYRDNQGRTPLHLAAHGGHTEIITALLNVWGHLLDEEDKDGNTPLHMAAKNNKPEAVNQLLSLNCKYIENSAGFMALDYAIQYKLCESANAIVTHERRIWHQNGDDVQFSRGQNVATNKYQKSAQRRSVTERPQPPSEVHGCYCIALIRALPKVFEAALNQAITKANVKEDSKDYYIKYSFDPLQLTEDQITRLALRKKGLNWRPPPLLSCNVMVKSGHVDLLLHPLTQKFLEMKWYAYGMYIHLLNTFVFLLFLGMVTGFAAGVLGKYDVINLEDDAQRSHISKENTTGNFSAFPEADMEACHTASSAALAFGILMTSGIGILKEISQIYQLRVQYFSMGINLIEWILYSTSIIMVLPVLDSSGGSLCSGELQYNSAAIAVFTAWFSLLLYVQRFGRIGIYIVMFLEILNTVLIVLGVFSVLIVAFGLAFFILLAPGNHLAHSTIALSMIRTCSMMLGEIDFMTSFLYPYFEKSARNDILKFPKTTFIILLLFMILMPILLMNLMIGLAVGDIESVKKNANLKRIAMQVELHSNLESKLPTCFLKRVNKQEVVVYPNKAITRNTFFQRLFMALNLFYKEKNHHSKSVSAEGGMNNQVLLEAVSLQKKSLNDVHTQLDELTKFVKLIVQKMEISCEAHEEEEVASHIDVLQAYLGGKTWTPSSASKDSKKLVLSDID